MREILRTPREAIARARGDRLFCRACRAAFLQVLSKAGDDEGALELTRLEPRPPREWKAVVIDQVLLDLQRAAARAHGGDAVSLPDRESHPCYHGLLHAIVPPTPDEPCESGQHCRFGERV